MKRSLLVLAFFILQAACSQSQHRPGAGFRLVGGPCEGCEAIFEYGDKRLTAVDTLPDFAHADTQIKVSGTVYMPDGTTPAEGVVLYIHHTDKTGIYPTKGKETGWAKRHGYIRGWVKTDSNGSYTFYTHKPGVYPSRSEPAHIHLTVLEPNGKYYWLSNFHFEGDPLLTADETNPSAPRGGNSGLLKLREENGLLADTRDIVLGKNVPDYE